MLALSTGLALSLPYPAEAVGQACPGPHCEIGGKGEAEKGEPKEQAAILTPKSAVSLAGGGGARTSIVARHGIQQAVVLLAA